jgi:hypothetical protein
MAGNEVRSERGSGLSQTIINLADLPGGIYLTRLLTQDNLVYSAKLILI